MLIITDHEYIPHVKLRNEEIEVKKNKPNFKARRWVVEVCHFWLNRFRKILIRVEKLTVRYEALFHWLLLLSHSEKSALITNNF